MEMEEANRCTGQIRPVIPRGVEKAAVPVSLEVFPRIERLCSERNGGRSPK